MFNITLLHNYLRRWNWLTTQFLIYDNHKVILSYLSQYTILSYSKTSSQNETFVFMQLDCIRYDFDITLLWWMGKVTNKYQFSLHAPYCFWQHIEREQSFFKKSPTLTKACLSMCLFLLKPALHDHFFFSFFK